MLLFYSCYVILTSMGIEMFKQVVIPLREKLLNFARNMLIDHADAEDAVQETYLRLWNKKEQLADHPNVGGFAMQTLKNICIDKLRAQKLNVSLDEIPIGEKGKDPYQQTIENEGLGIIKKIIDGLPQLQRLIIELRDVEGYELNEIAEITGSDITAVRVNLSRARKKVREKLLSINASIQLR